MQSKKGEIKYKQNLSLSQNNEIKDEQNLSLSPKNEIKDELDLSLSQQNEIKNLQNIIYPNRFIVFPSLNYFSKKVKSYTAIDARFLKQYEYFKINFN